MHHEDERFCVALSHDYGEVISRLVVPKDWDGNKDFSLPCVNIKLCDLEKVNGSGYEFKIGGKAVTIPSKKIERFVTEIRKDLAKQRNEIRQQRRR